MENPELELARQIIANTDTHLFLTGKAGTGKTTFLRELRASLPKRMVVVAPTGIAAINAQGTTIHSFFQLGFGPQIPGTSGQKKFQFRKQKLRLIRSIDLVVIDEISMVRADVLDAIDSVLRQYRDHSRPFGGVQMLMIGDMQQLAPVAKEDEWRLLKPYYSTPYFFSSNALQNANFVTVELKHVYRQSDPLFLEILNKVRTNTATEETLNKLNSRYIPDFKPQKSEGYIQLTTHNYQADAINQREMEALTTPAKCMEAKIDGEFPELSFPTDKSLTLKVGAQVMFVKNDSSPAKAYYNGMIGEVVEFSDSGNVVIRTADDDSILEVSNETWHNTRYTLNDTTKEIEEELIGSFSQIPLKTAWAITVHKSQGLTFEHAIIDVQHSFAHGQTYVALSRCKTLEGMVLNTPIPHSAIISDNMVEVFANDPRHQQPDARQLEMMQRAYMLRTAEELFSFNVIRYGFTDIIRCMREHFYSSHPKSYTSWNEASEKFKGVEDVARRFHKQYDNLIMSLPDFQNNELLQERITKGATYFEEQLSEYGSLLLNTTLTTENKQVKERITNLLQTMQDGFRLKVQLLHYVANNGLHIQDYLKAKAKIIINIDEKREGGSKGSIGKIATWAKYYKPKAEDKNTKKKYPAKEPGHVDISDLPY